LLDIREVLQIAHPASQSLGAQNENHAPKRKPDPTP
jgi:hypothetical protein